MTNISKHAYAFLGLPASGKGTQVAAFAKKRNLRIIGIGDLIRAAMETGDLKDPFFAEIKKRYKGGVPQPDDVVFDLVRSELEKIGTGIVFDNFPFSNRQAEYLDKFLDENAWGKLTVIYLEVDPETVVKRVVYRRVCSECKSVYIGGDTNICEKCGGALISRADDNEETIRKRIKHYLPRIEEIVARYGQNVLKINGEPPIAEVEKEIERKIKDYE